MTTLIALLSFCLLIILLYRAALGYDRAAGRPVFGSGLWRAIAASWRLHKRLRKVREVDHMMHRDMQQKLIVGKDGRKTTLVYKRHEG